VVTNNHAMFCPNGILYSFTSKAFISNTKKFNFSEPLSFSMSSDISDSDTDVFSSKDTLHSHQPINESHENSFSRHTIALSIS
jgi:hypothetical protein